MDITLFLGTVYKELFAISVIVKISFLKKSGLVWLLQSHLITVFINRFI